MLVYICMASAKLRIDVMTPTPPLVSAYLKLSFKDGGRDDFFNPLEASLKRKAWKDTQPSHLADRRLQKRQFNAADAGIAGILRRQQAAQKETTELATTAFSDLTNLMDKARDMVMRMCGIGCVFRETVGDSLLRCVTLGWSDRAVCRHNKDGGSRRSHERRWGREWWHDHRGGYQ